MSSPSRIGVLVAGLFLIADATHANTFIVTNANDAGAGSLRQAILDANAMQVTGGTACAPHEIDFAIPATELHTIQPLSPLPPLQISITLDGYTQPGSSPNTLLVGDNAVLTIELDGSLAGSGPGIAAAPSTPGSGICGGSGSTIRGLVINRFPGAGIEGIGTTCPSGFSCGVGGLRITGCFIGTDATGTIARGNGAGLDFGLNSTANIVGDQLVADGGPLTPSADARNIISANLSDGVYIGSTDNAWIAGGHRIRNNYIGVDASGTQPLPNGRNGVFADAGSGYNSVVDSLIASHPGDGVRVNASVGFMSIANNGIGVGVDGSALGNGGDGVHVEGSSRGVAVLGHYGFLPSNTPSIAYNAGAGVYVEGESSVDVISASIAANEGLGIDLAPRGVNPPDPVQPDTGPNELLNAPVITSVDYDPVSHAAAIDGTIDTSADTSVEIHVYASSACDPSGAGEGYSDFNFASVTTDAGGHASFHATGFLSNGTYVTALARRFSRAPADATILVSEFSACVRAGTDTIFADGFDA